MTALRSLLPLLAAGSLLGIVSQILRSSMGVLAPDLMREMGFAPEALGLLTGVFFVVYAAMQVPMGVALDRYGPRRVAAVSLCFAVAGCVAFAAAEDTNGLFAARFFMGLGASPLYMGAFAVVARWVEPRRFARVASVIVVLGNGGTLLATTPLAAVAVAVGWRGAFLAIAALAALAVVVTLLFLRDSPPGADAGKAPKETLGESLKGVWTVMTHRRVRYVMALAFVSYPVVASVFVLWGGPYLHDVHGLDKVGRGNVLLVMALAMGMMPLSFGWLDSRIGSRRTVLTGCVLQVVVLALLALLPHPGLAVSATLIVLLGACGGYGLLVPTLPRLLFPDHMAARVMTTVNLFVIGGVAVWQMVTGLVVGAFPEIGGVAPEIAYRAMFGVLAVAMAAGSFAFSRLGEILPPDADGSPAEAAS